MSRPKENDKDALAIRAAEILQREGLDMPGDRSAQSLGLSDVALSLQHYVPKSVLALESLGETTSAHPYQSARSPAG